MNEHPETLQRHAEGLLRQGRHREAIEAYRRLLALRPALADGWFNLGYLLKVEGDYHGALQAYGEALARGVAAPQEAHLNRAVIYADHLRRDEAAEQELAAALAIDPAYLPALLNLGNLQEERGHREAALTTYRRLLESWTHTGDGRAATQRAEALARIAHLQPPDSAEDPLLSQLEAAADNVSLDALTRANLLFALGRALDRLGLSERAFDAFMRANRQAGLTGPAYSRVRARRLTDALIRAFPAPSPGTGGPAAAGEPEPLFICGMFRSGSTLLEQVLAAHPQVSAGGEIEFLPRLVRGPLAPFPASAAGLDARRLAEISADYQAHLRQRFPTCSTRYLSDKRPDNYLLIGLIKRLFPAARIIHTVRHPLDTGLSIYMQHLDQRLTSYASDLAGIGHYIGEYRRLMRHWHQLYGDSILDFDYDAFVRAPRPALERLLAFLGLEWHEACLAFHRLDNTVKTASYWQVRQPLYAQASGRWRRYAAQLGPLRVALCEAGIPESELD